MKLFLYYLLYWITFIIELVPILIVIVIGYAIYTINDIDVTKSNFVLALCFPLMFIENKINELEIENKINNL